MRVHVFAGPSLPPPRRPADARLAWHAPARAGDMLVLEAAPGDRVVLIDGLFDAWPAVRHKELLILLAREVAVIGAASMGALRAAELSAFGMSGVGDIFRAYADGRLTGDDEVALLHGPERLRWAAMTEPLVNVRATLARAVRARVLGPAEARRLRAIAGEIFYPRRTWAAVLEVAAAEGLGGGVLARFERWLPGGRIDLKALDAERAVAFALMADLPRVPRAAPRATRFTEALWRDVAGQPSLD